MTTASLGTHSTLFAGELRALDLDLDPDALELDDTDLLPLEDADVVTLLRALDPFQAPSAAPSAGAAR